MLKKVFLLALMLTVFVGLMRLGFWQLSRAQEKIDLQLQNEQKQSAEVIDLNKGHSLEINDQYRNVKVKGFYLPEKQIFIDNRVLHGKAGYHLLTPLQLIETKNVVLVNRGWLKFAGDRSTMPEVTTPTGIINVRGRLNTAPSKPLFWKDEYPVINGQVWQYLPLEQYQKTMNLNAMPLLIELAPELSNAGGYVRQWRTVKTEQIDRHKAYAMQWFTMALVFLFCCMVVIIQSLSKSKKK